MRLVATVLFAVSGLAFAQGALAQSKPKKPSLDVRASPRMATSPATILFTAELKGGDELEEFHCPELEWEWDDGGRSSNQPDCEPYQAGTPIQRRFTAEHRYTRGGSYGAKLRLKRAGKTIASASINVTIRAGLGDMSDP